MFPVYRAVDMSGSAHTSYAYWAPLTPFGGELEDVLRIDFSAPLPLGDVDLGAAPQLHHATCTACLCVQEDIDGFFAARFYRPVEGTLSVSGAVSGLSAQLSFEGVRLVEIELQDSVLVPVEDGACIDLVDTTVTASPNSL